MRRHHHLGLRRDLGGDVLDADLVRARLAVGQHHLGAEPVRHHRRTGKRHRRHDHLGAGTDAERIERQKSAGSGAVDGNRVAALEGAGKRRLELLDLAAAGQPARFKALGDGSDLGTRNVGQRERQNIHAKQPPCSLQLIAWHEGRFKHPSAQFAVDDLKASEVVAVHCRNGSSASSASSEVAAYAIIAGSSRAPASAAPASTVAATALKQTVLIFWKLPPIQFQPSDGGRGINDCRRIRFGDAGMPCEG